MKKKYKMLVGLIFATTILCYQFGVFAADIPIKKIVPMRNSIMILSENGDLYSADSVYASTKELVARNVMDYYQQISGFNNKEYFAYTRDNRIIEIEESNEGFYEIEEEKTGSVKIPISLDTIYIDTNNNLKYEDDIVMKNVISADMSLVLTADGNLYTYDDYYDTKETKFLMSDVKAFNGDFFLKDNGDLYYRGYNNNINKVLSNVDNCNHFIEYNSKYYILDAGKNLYVSSHVGWDTENITVTKVKDNIRGLYYCNYNIYAVDIYGNLYSINELNVTQENTKGQKIGNIIAPFVETIFFTEDNILLREFSPIYEMGSIKTVVYVEDKYAFITTNGEVWVSDLSMSTFEKTQLSEKSMILKINGEDVKLENKLQLIDGRTMYPFRECLNLIGANVYWDGENRVAIGEIPGIKIEFPIGKNEYYVNSVKHEMDTAAYVDESIGRTYIPIRYAAEGLGFTVDWIPGDVENTISIHK